MKKIVFASYNLKKVAELQRMAPKNVQILCLNDIPEATNVPQAEENGKTFLENAKIKARYWAEKLNLPVIADDTGLEIDALNGYPGVYTKRCISELCPNSNVDSDNPGELYPLLLKLMEESGNFSTTAYWVSAMVYIDGKKEFYSVESLKGDMCHCAGDREFGFDQYFKPDGFNQTLAQLAPEKKDYIGPRNRAFKVVLARI